MFIRKSHAGHGFPDSAAKSGRRVSETDRAFNPRIGWTMMLRGLWKLTWIETKVFLREPLGAIGTIVVPVLIFIVLGRITGNKIPTEAISSSHFLNVGIPVLASLLITLS